MKCVGHSAREERRNKVKKLLTETNNVDDANNVILIKKGPMSVEIGLKDLEGIFMEKPEWDLIKSGKVLSVPVEELRMGLLPKADQAGNLNFEKKKGKHVIEAYPVGQTIENLNDQILTQYNKVKAEAKAAGKAEKAAEAEAKSVALKMSQFHAVRAWQDTEAEIKLKKALEKMMARSKIATLIIRSLNLKDVSALKELGLKIPKDAEIDLVMAYASEDNLNIVICEVKRGDTYPWQARVGQISKQAVNKAENQLESDVITIFALLANVPGERIRLHTLACFPDASRSALKDIFCSDCLERSVICQEDLEDHHVLQKKTQVEDKPTLVAGKGVELLLTLTARCLSSHSLLHVGFREIKDQDKIVKARLKYNLQSVDVALARKEFVIASHHQQQTLRRFSATSLERHLVLEGPAGSGKTLVALHLAKSLLRSLSTPEDPKQGPVLVATTGVFEIEGRHPLLHIIDKFTTEMHSDNKIITDRRRLWKRFGVW